MSLVRGQDTKAIYKNNVISIYYQVIEARPYSLQKSTYSMIPAL